jgi:hypothetical protein
MRFTNQIASKVGLVAAARAVVVVAVVAAAAAVVVVAAAAAAAAGVVRKWKNGRDLRTTARHRTVRGGPGGHEGQRGWARITREAAE